MNDYQKQELILMDEFQALMREVANEMDSQVLLKKDHTSCVLICKSGDTPIDLFCVCWPNVGSSVEKERLEVSINSLRASDGTAFHDSKRVSLTISPAREPKAIAKDLMRRAVDNPEWIDAQSTLSNRVLRANKILDGERAFRERMLSEIPGCHFSPSDKTRIYIKDIGSDVQQYKDTVYLKNLTLSGDDAIEILSLIVKRKRDERESE